MRALSKLFCAFLALITAFALLPGCETYIAPPEPALEGGNVLTDPGAPLVVRFGKSVTPESVRVKVIKLDLDANGRLPDERGDASTPLSTLFSTDPDDGERGGKSELIDGGTGLKVTLTARLPVGPKLAVLVEPGLSSTEGVVTRTRRRLLFSYEFHCSGTGTKIFPSGAYFLILNIEQPVGTQIRILAKLEVDAATGLYRGQFTNAVRNRDPARCPEPCAPTDACRLFPGPAACVPPSTRAGGVDEFPDYVPNAAPPTGFSFTVTGCAEDQPGGLVTFATAPANLVVEQPPVSVNGLVVIASFTPDAAGVLRATGTGTGDEVLLGKTPLGPGVGTITARSLTQDQEPPGIPAPPPKETP